MNSNKKMINSYFYIISAHGSSDGMTGEGEWKT